MSLARNAAWSINIFREFCGRHSRKYIIAYKSAIGIFKGDEKRAENMFQLRSARE